MRAVFILIDSLNRHFLGCYGAAEAAHTPNLDRLAARAVRFDQHWCGSSPCMPARRDIMTGRLNFMERPWGGIEPFDHTLPALLREHNVFTHMETDHFHYAERGGENYWAHFTSWKLHRGAEHDTLYWDPDQTDIPSVEKPQEYHGLYAPWYEKTRENYAGDWTKYSTPRTFASAAGWLERNHDADHFMLWVEGFDPHEPFDVPEAFLDQYPMEGEAPAAYWPDYEPAAAYSEEELRGFRRRYRALVSMTDRALGGLLDTLDRNNMWENTLVILTTDHGYLLGEHGYMAKCYMPDYTEVHHIPLLIAAPGVAPGQCAALTENIDIFPTMLDWFGVPRAACRNPIHGQSLLPLLHGGGARREELLFGVFGKTVSVFDGRYLYQRARVREDNTPLYIYGAQMSVLNAFIGYDTMNADEIGRIEMGRFLPWTNYPVYRVAANDCHWNNNGSGFAIVNQEINGHKLYDLEADPAQEHPLDDTALEAWMTGKLLRAMKRHDAPADQYIRLGLAEQEVL